LYQEIDGRFKNGDWQFATAFIVGIFAELIATTLGPCPPLACPSPWMPYKRLITALLLFPNVVPR